MKKVENHCTRQMFFPDLLKYFIYRALLVFVYSIKREKLAAFITHVVKEK